MSIKTSRISSSETGSHAHFKKEYISRNQSKYNLLYFFSGLNLINHAQINKLKKGVCTIIIENPKKCKFKEIRPRYFVFKRIIKSPTVHGRNHVMGRIIVLKINDIKKKFSLTGKGVNSLNNIFAMHNGEHSEIYKRYQEFYSKKQKQLIPPLKVIERLKNNKLSQEEAEAYFLVLSRFHPQENLSEILFKKVILKDEIVEETQPLQTYVEDNVSRQKEAELPNNAVDLPTKIESNHEEIMDTAESATSLNEIEFPNIPLSSTIYSLEEMEEYYREELEKYCYHQENI